jgi:hypothetical protein
MAKKRLVLRRNLTLDPPKPYVYAWGMTRQQFVYFQYRIEYCRLFMFIVGIDDNATRLIDAGYCLDSQVDSQHGSTTNVILSGPPKIRLEDSGGRLRFAPVDPNDPANAFVGGSRSTRPRDPNYVPGSFGGGMNRAGRGRY